MIVKVCRPGSDAGGLFAYIYSEGRHNEHVDQRMICSTGAGQDSIEGIDFFHRGDVATALASECLTSRDARQVARLIMQDARIAELSRGSSQKISKRHQSQEELDVDQSSLLVDEPWAESSPLSGDVMHVVMSAPKDERELCDETWSRIVTDYLNDMGWAGADVDSDARWAAFRHGTSLGGHEHVHIVVSKVRLNGSAIGEWKSGVRSRQVMDQLERKYDLKAARDNDQHKGLPSYSQSARRRANSTRSQNTEIDELNARLRASAGRCSTEQQFVVDLMRSGLRVRPRFARGGTSRVIGYSVALRGQKGAWYGGGRFGKDLTLPALRIMWGQGGSGEKDALPLWQRSVGVKPAVMADDYSDAWSKAAEAWSEVFSAGQRDGSADEGWHQAAANALASGWAAMAEGSHGKQREVCVDLARKAAEGGLKHGTACSSMKYESMRRACRMTSLMARGTQPQSAAGWFAVVQQMRRIHRSIRAYHTAHGHQIRAGRLMQAELKQIELLQQSLLRVSGARAVPSRAVIHQGRGNDHERP